MKEALIDFWPLDGSGGDMVRRQCITILIKVSISTNTLHHFSLKQYRTKKELD